MESRYFRLTFSPSNVTEPVVYRLGSEFGVVTNIRRANVSKDSGWVVLELQGSEEDVERAVAWAREKGVLVEPLSGDIPD